MRSHFGPSRCCSGWPDCRNSSNRGAPCPTPGGLLALCPRCRISSAVEQRFCKPKVGSSILSSGTTIKPLQRSHFSHFWCAGFQQSKSPETGFGCIFGCTHEILWRSFDTTHQKRGRDAMEMSQDLALSGQKRCPLLCRLLGVKRTWPDGRGMSANDPKRTLAVSLPLCPRT